MNLSDARNVLNDYLNDLTEQVGATLVRFLLYLARTSPVDFFAMRLDFENLGYTTPSADSARHFFDGVQKDENLCHLCHRGWFLYMNTVGDGEAAVRHYRCTHCEAASIKLS